MAKTIKIYGTIGFSYYDSEVNNNVNTAYRLVNEIDRACSELEKGDVLEVHINSVGGSIYEGLPVFNAIKHSKCEIHTYIDGLAASMAGIIALSGKKVFMYKSSILHLHKALGSVSGNSNEIKDYAKDLEVFENILVVAVAKKMGKSIEDTKNMFFDGKEHYLTPEKALEYSLVDAVLEQEAVFPQNISAQNITNMSLAQISSIYNKEFARKNNSILDKISNAFKTKNNIKMEKIIEKLGLAQNASEEDVLAAIDKIEKKTEEPTPEPKNDAEPQKEKLTSEKIKAIEEKYASLEAKVDKLLNKPVDEGGGAPGGDFTQKNELDEFKDKNGNI